MTTQKRRPSAAAVMAALALVVSLSGTAYAAGGHALLAGAKNKASRTTTLKVKGSGAALALKSKGSAASFTSGPTSPPFTVTSGTVVPNLDADRLDGLDSASFLRADTTPRTAFLLRSSNINVPTGTFTPVAPNAEQYDPADMFHNGTLAVPVSGTYLVVVQVEWEANSTGYRSVEIDNGALGGARVNLPAAANPSITIEEVSSLVHLAPGQAPAVKVAQSSGSTLNLTLDSLQISYVGP